jgi:hypothetical protein
MSQRSDQAMLLDSENQLPFGMTHDEAADLFTWGYMNDVLQVTDESSEIYLYRLIETRRRKGVRSCGFGTG